MYLHEVCSQSHSSNICVLTYHRCYFKTKSAAVILPINVSENVHFLKKLRSQLFTYRGSIYFIPSLRHVFLLQGIL